MPRAGQVRVPSGQRLSDRVALGVLTATFPRALVDEVIEATGRREQRNRLLPAHLSLYYVLAMTLFSSSGYEEVMRSLTEGLTWTSDGEDEYELPSQVAITKARARLGPEPLALLFERACVPLATPTTKGAFYRDWRLVSMDGTTVDVADTPANAEVFGRAGTGRGDGSAFPQVRVVALGDIGLEPDLVTHPLRHPLPTPTPYPRDIDLRQPRHATSLDPFMLRRSLESAQSEMAPLWKVFAGA